MELGLRVLCSIFSPLINIKRENLADATDANVAMSAPPRAYKLIVEVIKHAHIILTVDVIG